jgi:hypothetical protein
MEGGMLTKNKIAGLRPVPGKDFACTPQNKCYCLSLLLACFEHSDRPTPKITLPDRTPRGAIPQLKVPSGTNQETTLFPWQTTLRFRPSENKPLFYVVAISMPQ